MIDQGTGSDLLRDFAGIDGINNDNFNSISSGLQQPEAIPSWPILTDTSNQRGVVDVQLQCQRQYPAFHSPLDNAAYGSSGNSAQVNFVADGADNVIINFWTGGNQFGTTGQTSNNVSGEPHFHFEWVQSSPKCGALRRRAGWPRPARPPLIAVAGRPGLRARNRNRG